MLAQVAGATQFLQAVQDVRLGGRISNAQYQFTLQSDNLEELNTWAPRLVRAMRDMPEIRDVSSDQCDASLVGTMVTLAKQLKLVSVAEGVETAEQMEFLLASGCEALGASDSISSCWPRRVPRSHCRCSLGGWIVVRHDATRSTLR